MKFVQPSLSGGELSPGMRGRVDLVRYSVSLGKCRNMITKPTGGAAKRPGQIMRGRVKYSDRLTRLIPFVYSTQVKYLVEAGDGYMRFWVGGSLLTDHEVAIEDIADSNPAVVTAAGHGLQNGDQVVIAGVQGMTRVNGRTFTVTGATADTFQLQGWVAAGDAAYAGGGTVGRIVEVETPYTDGMIRTVRFTQSADVLFLVHGQVQQKELRRVSATSFQLVDFDFKRGPFRGFNSNEAHVMAVSGTTGIVTVSTNVDAFTDKMVGTLIYMEEKELQGVKPWASAEKNVPLNALRRSDSKVYRAAEVPSVTGNNYYVSGGVRPIHNSGRAWDGPGDVKTDGVDSYTVGVLWEFVHNTFGILKITEFVDERTVKAEVIERLPDSIVGTAPAPENSWTFSGDGATVAFSITGATSWSMLDYRVTINGVPVQSNPNYGGGGGVGGGGGGNPRPGQPIYDLQLL